MPHGNSRSRESRITVGRSRQSSAPRRKLFGLFPFSFDQPCRTAQGASGSNSAARAELKINKSINFSGANLNLEQKLASPNPFSLGSTKKRHLPGCMSLQKKTV